MLRIEPLPVADKKSYEEVVLYQQIVTKKTEKIVIFLFKIFCLITNVLPPSVSEGLRCYTLHSERQGTESTGGPSLVGSLGSSCR
jgi:hypothetical protein